MKVLPSKNHLTAISFIVLSVLKTTANNERVLYQRLMVKKGQDIGSELTV